VPYPIRIEVTELKELFNPKHPTIVASWKDAKDSMIKDEGDKEINLSELYRKSVQFSLG
jgi:hypothetical protein